MMLLPEIATSVYSTVTNVSQQLAGMADGYRYRFCSTTACWIKQGADPTAAATTENMFVGAGEVVILEGKNGAKLGVIRNAADGACSLTRTGVAYV